MGCVRSVCTRSDRFIRSDHSPKIRSDPCSKRQTFTTLIASVQFVVDDVELFNVDDSDLSLTCWRARCPVSRRCPPASEWRWCRRNRPASTATGSHATAVRKHIIQRIIVARSSSITDNQFTSDSNHGAGGVLQLTGFMCLPTTQQDTAEYSVWSLVHAIWLCMVGEPRKTAIRCARLIDWLIKRKRSSKLYQHRVYSNVQRRRVVCGPCLFRSKQSGRIINNGYCPHGRLLVGLFVAVTGADSFVLYSSNIELYQKARDLARRNSVLWSVDIETGHVLFPKQLSSIWAPIIIGWSVKWVPASGENEEESRIWNGARFLSTRFK